MQINTTKTIREIALENPVATRVFEEYKIDYCCGGGKMFLDACQSAGVNPETIKKEIEAVTENTNGENFSAPTDLTLNELINLILEKHHTFTRDEIEQLTPLMSKVAGKHGENHPELLELEKLFTELGDDLLQHLLKEEKVLFPYVIDLERNSGNNGVLMLPFGTVKNPVRIMMTEHDTAGDILKKMRQVSADYKIPEGACPSFTALYNRLEGLEKDLHRHIHLENNLLFPKAVKLEDEAVFGK